MGYSENLLRRNRPGPIMPIGILGGPGNAAVHAFRVVREPRAEQTRRLIEPDIRE